MAGFISTIFKTITQSIVAMVTFILFICLVCFCCVGIAVWAQQQQTNEVIEELNDGFGAEENPVPANTFMRFEQGEVRATSVDRNSSQRILDYSALNDDPAVGAAWVLVNIEVLCKQDECRERELGLWLVDADGTEYDEAPLMLYENKLDDGVRDNVFSGYQIFEVPTDADLTMLRVRWEGITLFGRLP